ncbi:hypothetical protein [uncultured Treponema sp.]|uniref:hypothetical protein n=1 Tax=uncultured Treponema sp. TaxID=162155 RepID=UPI0025F52956|nr:hypothetical protein [uncultured Treponema sp.]
MKLLIYCAMQSRLLLLGRIFKNYDSENENVQPAFYQSGYLTILYALGWKMKKAK